MQTHPLRSCFNQRPEIDDLFLPRTVTLVRFRQRTAQFLEQADALVLSITTSAGKMRKRIGLVDENLRRVVFVSGDVEVRRRMVGVDDQADRASILPG